MTGKSLVYCSLFTLVVKVSGPVAFSIPIRNCLYLISYVFIDQIEVW